MGCRNSSDDGLQAVSINVYRRQSQTLKGAHNVVAIDDLTGHGLARRMGLSDTN